MYDVVAKQVAQVLKKSHVQAKDGQKVPIQVDPESEEMWCNEVEKRATWYAAVQNCTPSYFTNEGESLVAANAPSEQELRRGARTAGWGAGPVDYQERLEAFAAQPDPEGFNVTVFG